MLGGRRENEKSRTGEHRRIRGNCLADNTTSNQIAEGRREPREFLEENFPNSGN